MPSASLGASCELAFLSGRVEGAALEKPEVFLRPGLHLS